ncbi:MAG: phage portal protein [Planctomycetales bacterium]|nr:phage portal protein [Planctomycetales bacterium]
MPAFDEVLAENQQLKARLLEAENRALSEAVDFLGSYVDPREAYRGPDGMLWPEVRDPANPTGPDQAFFANEQQLAEARQIGRLLERTNEFAINGHENRVNYVVGSGHTYKVVARRGADGIEPLVGQVQRTLDEFVAENRWRQRQQEIIRRRDRDGEVFLRFFAVDRGQLRVRFVEPDQVYRPRDLADQPAHSFGIETDAEDVENVLRYWIDGQPVEAAEIQHRKLGVDQNVKRGVPLFYPVRKNLWRAEKLLHNMAAVADIQTAIAMIRRHDRSTRSATEMFREGGADVTAKSATAAESYFRLYAPGTILDAPKTVQYEFPAAGLDAGRYVKVLQAILRSVASRLVFPEFMLTSDASNANYSSTLVAEGPAVKMFQRWQADMATDDLDVMWRVVQAAIDAGMLPTNTREMIAIQIGYPRVATRDEVAEAEVNRIYHELGVKSRQTIASELGLDYEQERQNLASTEDGASVPAVNLRNRPPD